jgi:hypothetical protein
MGVKTPCSHPEDRISRGKVFDYCEDCGAVRHAPEAGRKPEPWHTCERCRI